MLFSVNNETLHNATTKNLTALLNELKTKGVSNSAACKALGKPTSTVNTWKKKGVGAKQEHIDALLLAFPTQLTAKAKEMGLKIPVAQMKISEEERTNQVIEACQRKIAEMKEEMERMKGNAEESARLKQENALLLQQVDRLTKLLDRKFE